MPTPLPPFGTSQAAVILARLIGNLRQGDAQPRNDTIIREFCGSFDTSQFVASDGECPAFYYVKNSDQAILVIDGTTTMSQATKLWEGYGATLGIPSLDPRNDFIERQADKIATYLKDKGYPGVVRHYLAGWSLGGAIAHLVPSRVQVPEYRTALWSVDSFGAPRSGGPSIARAISTYATNTRWMNDNDPIPLIPPRLLDVPAITIIAGVSNAASMARFVHCPGGRDLKISGEVTAYETPTTAGVGPHVSLINWYFEWDQGGQPDHAIATYIIRLERSEAYYSHGPVPRDNRVEAVAPVAAAHANRVERQVHQAIVHMERQQGMDPVAIPPTRRFIAKKTGGVWQVTIGDSLVSLPGSKRAARALARHLNGMLNSLQNKAFVNVPGLMGGLQDYIDLASSPNGGFRPVMNTALPVVSVS